MRKAGTLVYIIKSAYIIVAEAKFISVEKVIYGEFGVIITHGQIYSLTGSRL
jgi:hypothetical protein